MSERMPADFVPLNNKSNYANLSGISATASPYRLAEVLRENGYEYFSLSETVDNGFLSLASHFDAAKKQNLLPIPGVEFLITPDWGHPQRALCLARDNEGLSALISLQNKVNKKLDVIHPGDIQQQKDHIYAILLGLLEPKLEHVLAALDNVFLGIEQPGQQTALPKKLQRQLHALHKFVVTPDIRMATLSEEKMLLWLMKIHDEAGIATDNLPIHTIPPRLSTTFWSEYWDMVNGIGITKELAEDVHVTLPQAVDIRPATLPEGWTSEQFLREWTLKRLAEQGLYDLRDRVEQELEVITSRERFSSAILIALEISEFFRIRNIPFTPTGSGDNCVVLSVLGHSRLDPREVAQFDFSRFISFAREGLPDIDMMIPYDSEVVTELWEYIKKLYGEKVHEIVSLHHLKKKTIDELARRFDAPVTDELVNQLVAANIPYSKAKHASKVVFADGLPLQEGMSRHGVEIALLNKDDVEKHFDFFPLDLLERQGPQRELIARRLVGKRRDRSIYPDDPVVIHNIFSNLPTIGISNIESPHMGNIIAQMGNIISEPTRRDIARAESLARMGKEIRERHYQHLRRGKSNLSDKAIRALGLKDGVIDTQEGLLHVGRAAGFSEKDIERIRKMLSDSGITVEDKLGVLAEISDGLVEKGFDTYVRSEVVQQLSHFVGYSFVEGHAQALANEAYRIAWYRTYYPKAFWTSVFTTIADKPGNLIYAPQEYINEALRYSRVHIAFPPSFQALPDKPIIKDGNILVGKSLFHIPYGAQLPENFAQMYGEWLEIFQGWEDGIISPQVMVQEQLMRFSLSFTHNPIVIHENEYWFDSLREFQTVVAQAVALREWKGRLIITLDGGELFRASIDATKLDAKTIRENPFFQLRIRKREKGNDWDILDVIHQSNKAWEV